MLGAGWQGSIRQASGCHHQGECQLAGPYRGCCLAAVWHGGLHPSNWYGPLICQPPASTCSACWGCQTPAASVTGMCALLHASFASRLSVNVTSTIAAQRGRLSGLHEGCSKAAVMRYSLTDGAACQVAGLGLRQCCLWQEVWQALSQPAAWCGSCRNPQTRSCASAQRPEQLACACRYCLQLRAV